MTPRRVRRSWLFLALLAPAALAAQTVERISLTPLPDGPNQWRSSGPLFNYVTQIVPDPSSGRTVYCLTASTIHKTANAGNRWISLGQDMGASISNLAINPSNPGVLLAAGALFAGGALDIFKSTNGGESWSRRNVIFGPTDSLGGLVWDEGRPNRVFLLAELALLMSLDEGETWTRIAVVPPSPNTHLKDVTVEKVSGVVYVVASNGGLYRSDGPQMNWTLISSPFLNTDVSEILTHPERTGTLYAATSQGFLISRDGGLTWLASNNGLPEGSVTQLVIDPINPDALYAVPYFGSPVFRSADGGQSWSLFLSGDPPLSIRSLAVTSEGAIFVGTNSGCFRVVGGATAWTPANDGLPGLAIHSVALDAASRTRIYAAAPGGPPTVWMSEDAGHKWSVTNPSPLDFYEGSWVITTDTSTPGIAYFGTTGCSPPRGTFSCYGSLFKTIDGGLEWRVLVVPGGPGAVLAIAVDPIRPEVLYVTGYDPRARGFRSLDGGDSWTSFGSSFPSSASNCILIEAQTVGTIFVGTAGSGVFKSADGGDTWQPSGLMTGAVNALAQDPKTRYLYAGTDGGLFESRDGGVTWTPRTTTAGVSSLVADSSSGSLYAAIVHGGIQVTSDGGLTWSPVGYGFSDISNTYVNELVISSDSSILYAATNLGVYSFQSRSPRRVPPR